jgi:bis(5'-adenosyl)-triphosphatase
MNSAYKANCPFCNINTNSTQFAESANFRAIYNIAPILPGHSLIIPKGHATSLLDLSEAEICEMVNFSQKCVRILRKAFHTTGFDWTIQEGEEAGQTIKHLHLHLIPRKRNDLPNPGDWYPKLLQSESEAIDSKQRHKLSEDQVSKVVALIKSVAEEIK